MEERATGRQALGILSVAGGLLAVVGSALVWFSVRADTTRLGGRVLTRSVKGTDASDGKVTLIAGLVVIFAAMVVLLVREGSSRKGLSALVSIGGLVAGGLALYDVATAKSQVIDAAVEQVGDVGFTGAQIRQLLERAFDTGILKIAPGIGVILVVAGGALALAGGIAGLFARVAAPSEPGVEVVPPMPAPEIPPMAPSEAAAEPAEMAETAVEEGGAPSEEAS